MYQAIRATSPADLARFCAVPVLGPLDPETLARSPADEHWMLADGDAVVARCSLWWTTAPTYPEHTVGLIGHYASADAAASDLLALACDRLRQAGCTLAVGPMDGSTFYRYRLVTERGSEPPFFLEPDNPDSYPAHWTAGGFAPLAQYSSALQVGLDQTDPRIPQIAARFEGEGVHIRSLDLDRFEEELRRIYQVSAASFGQNFLASPIAEEEFLALYQPVRPFLRPELVLLAERDERLLGFFFALPDWLQAQRGAPVDTVIVKTIAVLPECARQGLAALLTNRCRERARALGFTRAIHALMHEGNRSLTLSGAYAGHVIRRYTLFAKRLDGGG